MNNQDIIRKYADYFLTNNREVMEPEDIAELEIALTNSKQEAKNWVDIAPTDGVYIVRNIRFVDIDKLRKLSVNWKELNEQLPDDCCYDTEFNCLLAYYRMQAFLYHDCLFDCEHVSLIDAQQQVRNYLIDTNNSLAEQPYDYSYDLGCNDSTLTNDEIVDFLYPSTWLAVLPSGFELALTYLDKPDSDKLINQMVYEYLLYTLPVSIHCSTDHLNVPYKELTV